MKKRRYRHELTFFCMLNFHCTLFLSALDLQGMETRASKFSFVRDSALVLHVKASVLT